jgi:hypothetical protein
MKTLLIAVLTPLFVGAALAADSTSSGWLGTADDWKDVFPSDLTPTIEMSTEGPDGKPALKVVVPEGQVEAWKGKISRTVELVPGTYTLSFYAKAEPAGSVEVSVWGSLSDRPKNLGARAAQNLQEEWQEFLYSFSVDHADPKANITFGNMARGGTTFFLSDLRLARD